TPKLTLQNLTTNAAGSYSVIISSPYGSVTSSPAALAIFPPPIIQGLIQTGNQFIFTWSTISNLTYQLQYATNLVPPNWIDLGSYITATNNSISTTDTISVDAQRFYRIRLVP